ncbi:MAG: M1 family metallopeptidase, partial [candidate division Zixibacteria bacterium]|nr:M1 family metallopeptidase [candidate division Zixibacteria bacterium]
MRLFLTFFIIACLSLTSFGNDEVSEMPFLHLDPDTMTASQSHAVLASGKARKLDDMRMKLAATRTSFYDQSEYDVLYYKIKIAIDLENEYVDSATVLVNAKSTITGLNMMELDFVDSLPYEYGYPVGLALIVDSVYTESGQLSFEHHDNKLIVELDQTYNLDEEFSFSVRYHGAPYSPYGYMTADGKMNGDGLAFGTQRSLLGGDGVIPVCYSNCEPYDSRRWWPCKDRPDDKADSVDVIVTVLEPYYCSSVGILKRIEIGQGNPAPQTFSYHVSYPIVTYLVAIAISEYTIWSDWYHYGDNDSMEVINHVYPDMFEDYQSRLQVTPSIIEIFSDLFCQYPFIEEKYGHAFWEVTGAMEHQTCTSTMPSDWGTSPALIAHELAHQWWGDMISCESWHDIWLNEGFASYSEALYFEVKYGVEYYHDYMSGMEYWHDRSVYIYDTTNANDVFNTVVYDKGAWVCHMLRHYVGDDAFFNLLQDYTGGQYKYGSLTTEEFIEVCENSTGIELNEFFNDWVYGILYPVYTSTFYAEPDLSDGSYWICY